MDPNGTRHHLLLGAPDWGNLAAPDDPQGGLRYDQVRQELTLTPQPFRFRAGRGDQPPRLEDRRGAAVDTYGNIYWVAESTAAILVQSAGSGVTSLFWEPGVGDQRAVERRRHPQAGAFGPVATESATMEAATRLAGLTVTEDHYLVVGMIDPDGLLVFDLHAPAPPRRMSWPGGSVPTPFDLCARTGGGAFLLDRQHGRLWELDRHLRVISRQAGSGPAPRGAFGPDRAVAAAPCAPDRWLDEADAIPVDDAVAIEAAPGGRVLVLEQGEAAGVSTLRLITPGTLGGRSAPLSSDTPAGDTVRVVGHDVGVVPGDGLGTLYVADREGNQSYAYRLAIVDGALTATLELSYLPMRLFGGKALIAGTDGARYDVGNRWVPLVEQRRPAFAVRGIRHPATFDATVPQTVWHRLLLEASIPAGTSVRVETRTADDVHDLETLPWQPEPALTYRRSTGSEQPYRRPAGGYDTWEILFQRAVGRFLQLRLALAGDGRRTPRVRALRAYHPRFSYPEHYLPKAYREDPTSASFLERYLANVEGIWSGLEDRIVAAQALFDPRSCPPDALDWLLGWFDVTADPSWDEPRRRLFLRHAMRFLALRGTVAGMVSALRLALDQCVDDRVFDDPAGRDGPIRIVERFRSRRVSPAQLGDPTRLTGPRLVPLDSRWDPAQGGALLVRRWRAEIGDQAAELPLTNGGPQWEQFWRQGVGIDPPSPGDPGRWTRFLTGRYRRIDALDDAYGLVGAARHADFAAVPYPDRLPPDGAGLRDWYQYVSVVVPADRAAHRFSVLVAVPGVNLDLALAEERRAIVQRIVELQKPAHTLFDVRFFWSAFRLGEARLAEDTVVGLGGRDPQFHRVLVLGQEHVGESSAGGDPAPVPDQVGRNPLNG